MLTSSLISCVISASCYGLALVLCLNRFLRNDSAATSKTGLHLLVGLALVAHAAFSWQQLVDTDGLNLSLFPLSVLIFLIINLIVATSALKSPLENLYLLLFPATLVVLLLAQTIASTRPSELNLAPGLGIHILISILSYSLMSIAALQALLLAWQNRQLHLHHPGGRLKTLPPLQTMEELLFRLLLTGFVLLSAGLITGFFYTEDFFAQHLAHKTVFSLIAWLVYAILLWGHYRIGWRGKVAIYWTLSGFAALMLAFWGTKFVLEILLA